MILSDPSFERFHCAEYYALILKLECPEVMTIIVIIGLFFTAFSSISANFFCNDPWSAYNNITYTKIGNYCSNLKVSYKCSSNYYHFSSSITFIFYKQGVFFAFFSVCEQLYFSCTSCEIHL